jgi:hypothetical protein
MGSLIMIQKDFLIKIRLKIRLNSQKDSLKEIRWEIHSNSLMVIPKQKAKDLEILRDSRIAIHLVTLRRFLKDFLKQKVINLEILMGFQMEIPITTRSEIH